jgi:hypothetical protein
VFLSEIATNRRIPASAVQPSGNLRQSWLSEFPKKTDYKTANLWLIFKPCWQGLRVVPVVNGAQAKRLWKAGQLYR